MSAPQAAPLANAGNQTEAGSAANLQRVRHGWGGVGIYIGPSYGYYDGGHYYDDDYYRPRRSYYYSDDYYSDEYDRPHRRHGYRWTQERFKHPLGRR